MIESSSSSSPLPRWLSKHVTVSYDADDIAALINSIDSSQRAQPSSPHLPAEIVLRILEYVPVDHILDWRLVCRGFRDAIGGSILYHHLRRTELLGYVGPRDALYMSILTDEQYDQLHLVRAKFLGMSTADGAQLSRFDGPIWGATHAIFKVDDSWMNSLQAFADVAKRENREDDVTSLFIWALERLQMRLERDSFGNLSWCMKLDHAVLDADLPPYDCPNAVSLHQASDGQLKVIVTWKDMLVRFLKTERALRRMLEQKQKCDFTFSHLEDCLREVRRQRLHASLDPDKKADRRRKWSLRGLPPLFGKPSGHHSDGLELIEDMTMNALLLFRREAAMSSKQISSLRQLDHDRQAMEEEMEQLDQTFRQFRSHMTSGIEFGIDLPTRMEDSLPRNPIAWPDELCVAVEERVSKWKSQRRVIRQVHALLSSSNEALAVPEDSFDDLGSQL
ncbi:hypothetical protein FB567DRAFT_447107 [Paraphoma chrysanthemicola]|uniref:F-box domain-containing protein n=1 Tax=Paraphoma chrysanthemicola TaxID=798071 RepID=A0A8K0R1R6_9PLEO|nr:hypothetical protein FB567DRAFT_447107 [Paraphoma chrysanthemicola]